MSIATLSEHPPPWVEHPPDAETADGPSLDSVPDVAHAALPDLFIREYAVSDPRFLRRAAADLMQLCLLRGSALPPAVVAILRLSEDSRHAMGMVEALSRISDLEERRRVLCHMIHAIVRLQ